MQIGPWNSRRFVGIITVSPKASNGAANGFQYLLDACDFNAVEFIKCS